MILPVSRSGSIILALFLSLASVEGVAYWWMHPAASGLPQPILRYRPEIKAPGIDAGVRLKESATSSPDKPTSEIHPQVTTFTPLPDIYDQAAPMLRCSGGQVFHAKLDESVGLHIAFFEWDHTDTGSVLEAFRHMPEACMGSIGMILVSKEKPIPYQVGGESILFDHTIFREPGQGGGGYSLLVHAFRAVWVAGLAGANAREGLAGDDFDRLRTIRLKSALTRFRPSYACVIQGAVRGVATADEAWKVFQTTMLKDLRMENAL